MPRLATEGRNGEVGEETRQVQRGGAEPKKDMGGIGRREEESTDKGGQGEKEREKRGKLDSSRDKTIANWRKKEGEPYCEPDSMPRLAAG